MSDYKVLSQAELDNELVGGDRIDLVYDFKASDPYWLGVWADAVDKKLSKVDIYNVTGWTNNGDGTVTFHVEIKPYVTRLSDMKRISIATMKEIQAMQAQGLDAYQLTTEPAQSASPGMMLKYVAVIVIAIGLTVSFKTAYLWATGQSAGKGVGETISDSFKSLEGMTKALVVGLALYVAWKLLD